MRTPNDAHLSLARYVAEALPDDFETWPSEDQGPFKRPFALVGPSGPALETGPAAWTEVAQPFTVHAWPVSTRDPERARRAAYAVAEDLRHAFRVGVGLGGPLRVPLWDYEGADLDETSVTRGLSDYLRVNDLGIQTVRDPDDPKLYEVVADVRLGWRRRGRVPSGTEPVRRVNMSPTETT